MRIGTASEIACEPIIFITVAYKLATVQRSGLVERHAVPFVVLILYIAVYSAVSIKTLVLTKVCRGSCCAITKHSKDKARPGATRFDDPLPAEHQQLITHPSVTVISYGTRKD